MQKLTLKTIFLWTFSCLYISSSHAELVADYFFESNLNSSVTGAPALISLAQTPQYQTETIAERQKTALFFEAGEGLQLDISTLIDADEYSIVILFYFSEITSYRKLVDFKQLSTDFGLYNNSGTIDFYNFEQSNDVLIQPNTFVQLVMTRAANSQTDIYINKIPQISFMDTTEAAVISSNNLLYFFVDDFSTDTEQSAGAVARISVYDTALSSAEVSELELLDIIFADDFEPSTF